MPAPDLLTDLNPEQHQAVTHQAGPLLVVAGAGTGKTTVISRRIAWLIQEHLAKPSEILALTFTEKAAGEMEARVDQLVPYGSTDTTIATFHSFGDRLLREYALDVGLPPEFRVLGSDEQLIFLAERIDQIDDIVELRPAADPRKYLGSVLKVISRAKDELITPEKYLAVARDLLNKASTDEEQRIARRQLDVGHIYSAYEHWKADEGVIDFGDQILLLTNWLTANPTILNQLQARYTNLLVDEFQDTNVAQYQLVKLLIGAAQNITVVGDDDQAIYKFRGAAVSNILGFLDDFPKAKTVVLLRNYRSTQPILDVAYRLIRHNDPDRLEAKLAINKQLIGKAEGTPPVFYWYHHEVDEFDGLVFYLKETAKTTPLNSIAILVRSNTAIGPLASALDRADIAYTASSDTSFPQLPEIRGVIAFFQALVSPSNSLATMKLALSPFYRFEPAWALAINDVAKKTNRDFQTILQDESSVAWQRIPDEGKTALRELRTDLEEHRKLLGSKQAGEILYTFLKHRGILRREFPNQPPGNSAQLSLFETANEEQRLTMIANVAAVFDAIKRYSDAGRDPFSLAFVERLDSLLSTVVPPAVDLGPDIDAVHILTVHAAKGLEFDTVFLPGMMSDRFPARRRHEGLELPNELIAETLPTGDEHLEEERRLAYVAITRAKRQLFISGSAKTGDGVRTKKGSPFVFEALGISDLPPAIERVAPAARVHTFAPIEPVARTLRLPEYDGVLFLSPAMIETYQHDPYNFYWRYVLKAPSAPNRHISYGNAIHAAIETYYRLRTKNGSAPLDRVLTSYAEAWRPEGYESKADEERRFTHGQETLRRFIERAEKEPLPTMVEEEFVLGLPSVRIRGRMDAIFQTIGEIRDFKTSQVKDAKEAHEKVKHNIPIKIYALAYRKRFGELPKALTLDFVEHDVAASIVPDDALIDEVSRIIRETADGIRAGNFEPNPDNPFKDYLK